MRILIVFILILFANLSFGQIAFHKVFSQGTFDFGYGIDQLEDSSYIVTGASGGFGSGSQAFLLKLDKFGDYEWSLGYGGLESEQGKRVIYIENVGYFIGGTTNSFGNGAYDFYLTKIALDGTQEWEYTFGGAAWDRLHDMVLTRDSGFVLIGENSSNTNENQDGYIVRTDKNGMMIWEKKLGDGGDDVLKSIRPYNDSSFVIGGDYYNADSSMYKGVLYKVLDDGTVLDTVYLGDNGNYGVNDIEVVGGQIEAVGFHENTSSQYPDQYVWEVDLNTNAIISQWGATNSGAFECITSYDNDSKRYLAYNFDGPATFSGGVDASIALYNENLNYLNTAGLITGEGLDQTSDAVRTSDGGAVFVGTTTGPGFGVSTVFVTKFGPGEVYPDLLNPIVYNLVGLPELNEFGTINIYPNPFKDRIHIEGVAENSELKVYSLLGELVLKDNIDSDSNLNLSLLSNGAYIITLDTGGKIFQQRVIKY